MANTVDRRTVLKTLGPVPCSGGVTLAEAVAQRQRTPTAHRLQFIPKTAP